MAHMVSAIAQQFLHNEASLSRPRSYMLFARGEPPCPIPRLRLSNEEYYPLPQTSQQKAVERRMLDMAGRNARRLGQDRRAFLSTSCGMATAFAAMNSVFGPCFRVDAAEMLEPAAAASPSLKTFISRITSKRCSSTATRIWPSSAVFRHAELDQHHHKFAPHGSAWAVGARSRRTQQGKHAPSGREAQTRWVAARG